MQQLNNSDATYCDHREGTPALIASFNGYTKNHEMTIHHDDGPYRHVSFRSQVTSIAWFELVTWPGNLTITGDMGTFTFKAGGDMFAFFNQNYINPGYWMEKLKHSTHSATEHERAYSEAAFKTWMFQDFWENSRDLDQADTTQWWNELVEHVFSTDAFVGTEEEAVGAIESMDLPSTLGRHYDDLHELRDHWLQNWWNLEWCMAAILAGVRTYNQHVSQHTPEMALNA